MIMNNQVLLHGSIYVHDIISNKRINIRANLVLY